jgi:uncharacterized protein (DUF433 family)
MKETTRVPRCTYEPVHTYFERSVTVPGFTAHIRPNGWHHKGENGIARNCAPATEGEHLQENTMPILTFQSDPVPLWQDERGDVRAARTRILFDVLIDCHQQGMSPEQIAEGYPDLSLADVYAVLAWYYRHKNEADEYLQRREEDAKRIRQKIEANQPPLNPDLLAKINAYKAQRDAARATPPV